MGLSKQMQRVTEKLDEAIEADFTPEERAAIRKIVQKALLDATDLAHETSKKAAVACCGPEADLAHKIQEQMDKKRDALIANLIGMR
jgi:hypothetical protein